MKMLRPQAAAAKCGFGLSTLWRKVASDPDFPKPIKLSDAITSFVDAELDAYLETKVQAFRTQPTTRSSSARAAAASVQKRAEDRTVKVAKG